LTVINLCRIESRVIVVQNFVRIYLIFVYIHTVVYSYMIAEFFAVL